MPIDSCPVFKLFGSKKTEAQDSHKCDGKLTMTIASPNFQVVLSSLTRLELWLKSDESTFALKERQLVVQIVIKNLRVPELHSELLKLSLLSM